MISRSAVFAEFERGIDKESIHVSISCPFSQAMTSLRSNFYLCRLLICAIMLQQVSMSYTPSYEVRAAHYTGFSSRSFEQLFDQPLNANNDYIIHVISLPILLLVMGFLSLLVLSGILISQCCCECARCIPETPKEARTSRIILTTMLSFSVVRNPF